MSKNISSGHLAIEVTCATSNVSFSFETLSKSKQESLKIWNLSDLTTECHNPIESHHGKNINH